MKENILDLVPQSKFDLENAKAIVGIGYPDVEPVLPQLLEWMQDLNWPVAQTLQPFLASIGAPLAPYLRPILGSKDNQWIYWVVELIIGESKELASIFKPELDRMANLPTDEEKRAELHLTAQEVLKKISPAD